MLFCLLNLRSPNFGSNSYNKAATCDEAGAAEYQKIAFPHPRSHVTCDESFLSLPITLREFLCRHFFEMPETDASDGEHDGVLEIEIIGVRTGGGGGGGGGGGTSVRVCMKGPVASQSSVRPSQSCCRG